MTSERERLARHGAMFRAKRLGALNFNWPEDYKDDVVQNDLAFVNGMFDGMTNPPPHIIAKVAKGIGEAGDYGNVEELWKAKEHSGDCTNQAWTCAVCLREELELLAHAAIAALAEALRDD